VTPADTTPTACSWSPGAPRILDTRGRTVAAVTDTPIDALDPQNIDGHIDLDETDTLVAPCGLHTGADAPPSLDALGAWSQDAWDTFTRRVTETQSTLASRGVTLVIRPGAGGRLSDAICTRAWIDRAGAAAPAVLADPVGWLTPAMLVDAEDHLDRFAETLDALPNLWGVLERSCADDGSGALTPTPIASGTLEGSLVRGVLDRIRAPRRIVWGAPTDA